MYDIQPADMFPGVTKRRESRALSELEGTAAVLQCDGRRPVEGS